MHTHMSTRRHNQGTGITRTITKDIFNLYINERAHLKSFIKNHSQRICITADTWTSIQRVNYMCLTAHFIDDDWVLQKRILNLCPIFGHKSEEVGKGVEKCLLEWEIEKIFTITVDNTSSNDGAVVFLQKKLDKYCGSIEKMNMILYYAVILDPRRKLRFIEFSFDAMYDDTSKSVVMREKVKYGIAELFDEYKSIIGTSGSPVLSSSSSIGVGGSQSSASKTSMAKQYKKYLSGGKSDQVKSELEKYLGEDVKEDCQEFDILKCWKVSSNRFPILSKTARDVLAIPVSTVASKSAFSTGGRVLDPFRSSLSPKIVQALICSQDWFCKDSKPISVEEDLTEIEMIEKESTKLGVDSTVIDI